MSRLDSREMVFMTETSMRGGAAARAKPPAAGGADDLVLLPSTSGPIVRHDVLIDGDAERQT